MIDCLNHAEVLKNSSCRYTDIKEDIAEELDNLREEGKALENVKLCCLMHYCLISFYASLSGIAKKNIYCRGKRNPVITLQSS